MILSRHVPEGIRISPNVWPGTPLSVEPGDVSQFVPMGFCGKGPTIMRPWDTLNDAMDAGDFYGANPHTFHPLRGSPVTEPSGGVLYFNSGSEPDAVIAALKLMHAPTTKMDYAVFVSEAEDPQSEGYLVQCRLVPFHALVRLFGTKFAGIEGECTPQAMSMADFVRKFIALHEARYGTGLSPTLYGIMGGDGDWAKEKLSFGFMMENETYGVCRIWTRAWLVTK